MKLNVKIKDIAFGTSIQDITVPAILKKRIKTGLGYFDTVIGGEEKIGHGWKMLNREVFELGFKQYYLFYVLYMFLKHYD